MRRRSFVGCLFGACAAYGIKVSSAFAWALVTEDQANEIDQPRTTVAPGSADGKAASMPVIEIIEPDIAKPVQSPVKIRIRFQASTGASINPASFRATYGWFDITDQLMSHAKVDASGISADDAEIPKGRYKIRLQISDTKNRVGTTLCDFQVL